MAAGNGLNAGGTAPAVYGLYQSGSTLNAMQLPGGRHVRLGDGGGNPEKRPSNRTGCGPYSQAGQLLAYAQTAVSDLVVASTWSQCGHPEIKTHSMPTPLSNGNYFLCMGPDEVSWTMLAAVNSQDGSGGQGLWGSNQGAIGDGFYLLDTERTGA